MSKLLYLYRFTPGWIWLFKKQKKTSPYLYKSEVSRTHFVSTLFTLLFAVSVLLLFFFLYFLKQREGRKKKSASDFSLLFTTELHLNNGITFPFV